MGLDAVEDQREAGQAREFEVSEQDLDLPRPRHVFAPATEIETTLAECHEVVRGIAEPLPELRKIRGKVMLREIRDRPRVNSERGVNAHVSAKSR